MILASELDRFPLKMARAIRNAREYFYHIDVHGQVGSLPLQTISIIYNTHNIYSSF